MVLYDSDVHVVRNAREELEILQSIQWIEAVEVIYGFGGIGRIHGEKFQWFRVGG